MANVKDIKMNVPQNRLAGDMPKIGIRPTIDGRLGGVRESLEEQTMNMAQSVANLLSNNLRHPNGLPVDPFADSRGRPLGVSNTTPVYIYSYGPDTDESQARQAGDRYIPEVLYDPTNGTISHGDLFIAIPR